MKARLLTMLVFGGTLTLLLTLAVVGQAVGRTLAQTDAVAHIQSSLRVTDATTAITMAHNLDGQPLTSLEYHALLYETAHPDVDVHLLYNSDLFSLMASASADIDIFMIDCIWPGEATANHWLVPLDDYVSASSVITLTDFLTGTVEAATVDGHLMAIPWFTDAGLLYYRTDLLATYSYTYPRTFDELKTQALTIKAGDGVANGFVWQGAEYEGLTCNFLEYVWGTGGDIFASPCTVVLSSTQSIDALDTMIDYINSGVSPEAVVDYWEEDGRQIFQDGDAVFMRNWPYAWALLQQDGSPVKDKVGIAPMPHAPGQQSAATLGGWFLGINSLSTSPHAAFEFIEFLTHYDQQKYNALHQSWNPTRIALYQDSEVCSANPFMCELFDVFIEARSRPQIANYTAFSAALQEEVHDALVGNKASAQAIADAQVRLQRIAACRTYVPMTLKNYP